MDENLRRIHEFLEYKFKAVENILLLASNRFNGLEQAVNAHTALDPETLTADECRAREPESTILINRLQVLRKAIDHIQKAYEIIVCKNLKHLNIKLKFPLFNFHKRQQTIERILLEGNGLISGDMALGI
ncbi:hypothetical protein CDAR_264791 [Caerostris darwini]|uniref:Uncharacterized protein n=1 Tax=Caerostris darwini TaxID=1538125 RepID=A0AAV4NLY1_9ARAC|nr:hypothetical protein CDAR_264791 [Caerostris darwini]